MRERLTLAVLLLISFSAVGSERTVCTNAVRIPLGIDVDHTILFEAMYAGGQHAPDTPVLDLLRNLAEKVEAEVNSGSVRSLIARGESLSLDISWLPTYSLQEPYNTLVCLPNGVTEDVLARLNKRISRYVRARFQWHSSSYAMASLAEREVRAHQGPMSARDWIRLTYPDVPDTWLQRSDAGGVDGFSSNSFVVIDRALAWVFHYDMSSNEVSFQRRDAQEFDPKLRPIFDLARRKAQVLAQATVQEKNLVGARGSGNFFLHELQQALLKRKIQWLLPTELNPEIVAD